ncbi:uncharacterized protein LOC119989693 isoform X2 [Tripterygium wilfordii]|uniref:uncharacterized protein LOC119989693 isoform X2 n=1 Tax=Tripterygium wilfordii TaxID=458696 RepID=UPI0018F81EC7|nr:uncharacterized protein LOC119989693 isoform X2 [Tripterygium wilfordii]
MFLLFARHVRRSIMSKKKPGKLNGLERRRKTKRSCLEKRKATVEKLSVKFVKKKENIQRMKKEVDDMMATLDETESECATIRNEHKLAIERNDDLQFFLDYMLFTLLRG